MDIDLFLALVVFYFVMYVTPGPNNAMVLASGLKFGFVRTIPAMAGITIGHIVQLILVCLGLGKVFQIYPEIQFFLKIMCAFYLLYLGYKIVGSFSRISEDGSKPIRFHEAALFQIINPKAWSISSMAASSFLTADRNLMSSISLIAIVALIICPISICPWAIFGAGIKRFIKNSQLRRIIEYLLVLY